MPAYSFEAVDAQGKPRKGVLDAESARGARNALRAQALVPLQVTQLGAAAPSDPGQVLVRRGGFTSRVFRASDLAVWTRQLAGLVSASLPLERALTALCEETPDPRQRHLVAALRAEVNAGSGFAKALAQYPREFSPLYVAVIGAGEDSGNLGLVLERLADDLAEQQALRARLIGAALYPTIVTLVAIMIVAFLMAYVVPQVAQVFAGTRQSLPWLTVLLLAGSALVRSYWLLLLGATGVLALVLRLALRNATLRQRFDAAVLQLPLLGRLARDYNAARFASTLAMLAAAGVPILKALQSAAETLGNQALRADALAALVLVREGAPIASALGRHKRFPVMLAMFARLGEQTGQLPLMLRRVAGQLGADVQRRAMQLATVLEPLLIVAMGLVVMLIVLAVMLPIIQLNTLVR